MKYKKTETTIVEDKEIFTTMSLGAMSRKTGYKKGMLSIIKNNKRIPSEEWYLNFVKLLGVDKG